MSMEHDPASRDPWPAAPSAKPLEWEPAGADDYSDKRHGFYIAHQPDDEPAYRWQAAWGEGDSFNFATLAEAKAWCQEQLDAWVREFVVAPGPEPLQEVITWVPESEAEKVPGMERVAIVEWAGRRAKRCVMWDAEGWLDAWSLQHVRNRVLFVAEVGGPQ